MESVVRQVISWSADRVDELSNTSKLYFHAQLIYKLYDLLLFSSFRQIFYELA